jgi:penicillin-insensitive murein DD-endopeptidase
MKIPSFLLLIVALFQTGCFHWLGLFCPFQGGIGTTSDGALNGEAHLTTDGEHYRLYRRADRAFGTPALVGAVERASVQVASLYPGTELAVGDLSANTGGRISGHRSHRAGRDVDFGFYVTDLLGEPVSSTPLSRFDRFGVSAREDEVLLFDTARNWALVEALIKDDAVDVQWIFVSKGLKALLIEWGIDHATDIEIVERAVDILKQPGDSAPHDDHFHVRIYCPLNREGAFCVDTGPIWPWVEEKRETDRHDFSREAVLSMALDGL